jgi:hypothetical protein
MAKCSCGNSKCKVDANFERYSRDMEDAAYQEPDRYRSLRIENFREHLMLHVQRCDVRAVGPTCPLCRRPVCPPDTAPPPEGYCMVQTFGKWRNWNGPHTSDRSMNDCLRWAWASGGGQLPPGWRLP